MAFVLCLTMAVPTWAIQAKPKQATGQPGAATPADTAGRKRATTHKTASTQVLLEKLKQDVRESKKSDSPQYDNYIDANNDGVDDRVKEKAKPASTEPTQTIPQARPVPVEPIQSRSKAKPATTTIDTSRGLTRKKKTP